MRPARFLCRRLVAPFLDRDRPPEHAARGVLLGLLIGFTPTVGFQLPLVLALWALMRKFAPRWDFNLAVALAWTLVSNPITMPPLYYLFVVTGRLLLGRWDRIRDYGTFSERLQPPLDAGTGWLESLGTQVIHVLHNFGLPALVGCIPWAVLAAGLGYRWSLRLIVARRQRRAPRPPRRERKLAGDTSQR